MSDPRPGPPGAPVDVFISYSHDDERFRRKLEQHLSLLHREGMVRTWHDRRISAGSEWAGAIDDALESSSVVLLLISPSFMASRYCWDVEMERAMQRQEAGEARVIPVLLRVVDWMRAPFGKLQALPSGGKFVTKWGNRDEAFTSVAIGIREAVLEMAGATMPSPRSVGQRRPMAVAPAEAPAPMRAGARRHQVAAVCYRRGPRGIELLLVRATSGRWIFPKGTVEPGEQPWETAIREAHEEGGVSGVVSRQPFTTFVHLRRRKRKGDEELEVDAYLLEAGADVEPPQPGRAPTWFSAEDAAAAASRDRSLRYANEYRRVIEEASRLATERG